MELPTRPSYPRWVLLQGSGMAGSPSSTADAQTMVTALTSAGEQIQLYLNLAEPPMGSAVVCARFPDGRYPYCTIIAAHGDSILIKVCVEPAIMSRPTIESIDLFAYNAGASAAAAVDSPPSLSLLPPCYLTVGMPHRSEEQTHLAITGMLRCGEDEIVVAELEMVEVVAGNVTPELLLFRSGEWSVKRPQIRHGNRDIGEELVPSWTTDTVVPVAGRLLCWVDLSRGVLLLDVFEEETPTPRLQFLPLPMDPCYGRASHRNVCATAGGAALKFVNIFPRCCCGGQGAADTGCDRSRNAYTINTWTMRVSSGGDMEWVKEGTVHNTDLWGLDAYSKSSLPRLMPRYPVVSLDEPHAICLLLSDEEGYDPWLIMVDNMKWKTLTRNLGGSWDAVLGDALIPSSLSSYLNSACPTSFSSSNDVTSTGLSDMEMGIVDEQPREHNAKNLTVQSSCESSAEPAVQASEILVVLQEIPTYGLDDDMLKSAYRILSQGNGHRFRSLVSLPTTLRKDWLLMEIKASEEA